MVDGHISITPSHFGVEPVVFTYEEVDYAPLDDLGQLGFALYATLDSDQQSEVSITNEGLILGVGEDYTEAPLQVGTSVGDMSEEQQALVTDIITAYVGAADEAFAGELTNENVPQAIGATN